MTTVIERVAVLEALRESEEKQRAERREDVNTRLESMEGKIDSLHNLVDGDIRRRNGNGHRWRSMGLKVGTPTAGGVSVAAIILWILEKVV